MSLQKVATAPAPAVHDEMILVVPTQALFAQTPPSGFLPLEDFDAYYQLITQHKQFQPRSVMETDPTYKQIIPYLVFMHDDKLFLMQRRADASEKRLASKLSLGIGGHVQEQDLQGSTLFDWARREFDEEIDYQGTFSIKPLGLVNDESSDVGRVHLGCVFLLQGDSDQIRVRAELKEGYLASFGQCDDVSDRLETWSGYVYDYLKERIVLPQN